MQMAPQEDWSFMQACLHVEDDEDWWDSSVVPNDTVSFVDDDQEFVRVESGMIGESSAEVLTASETFVRVREGTKDVLHINFSVLFSIMEQRAKVVNLRDMDFRSFMRECGVPEHDMADVVNIGKIKRKHRMIINRQHAKYSRDTKKRREEELTKTIDELLRLNQDTTHMIDSLEKENAELKKIKRVQ